MFPTIQGVALFQSLISYFSVSPMLKRFDKLRQQNKSAHVAGKNQRPLKLALEDGNELIALDLRWSHAKYIDCRLSLAILEMLFFRTFTLRPSGVSHLQGLAVCGKT